MSTSQEADEYTPESSFNLFLHAHGSKIQQLCLKPYRFPVGEILQACPNIEHMVATEVQQYWLRYTDTFNSL